MQDVDCPAHVQPLALPARYRGSRMQDQPLGLVAQAELLHGIGRHRRRQRDLGHELAIRATELKRAVRLSIELIAFLMNGAVVPATKHGEIRERGGASIGPMPDVMALPEPNSAAREAAATVAMVERTAYRRRDRAGPGCNFHDPAVAPVLHHRPARVARQAPGRFCRNVRAILVDCTPRLRHKN
jgi:hypothetical protein